MNKKRRRLRAGIDYATCSTSKVPSSPVTTRRKRRRCSKSEPPSSLPTYRTLADLPQEVFHQILSFHTEPSTSYDNAATLTAVASTCRSLHRQTSDFASSILWSDYKITAPLVGSPIAHFTRHISSLCTHCATPVLQFRKEPFSGFTCCSMCDSRYHTKISEQRAIRDYHLSKRQLSTLVFRTFEEHNPASTISPRTSRQNSPADDETQRDKYINDANHKITVYLEADVAALATSQFHRPVYPTLRTTRGLDENWAILQRTFEQNGIFISPQMYLRWTARKKGSPAHHHIARDIKLLQIIFEDIPFPDRLYNLWWRERFSGWMAMNLATSMEDDDTRAQFHELFERTFNRKQQTRSEILQKWAIRSRAWGQRAPAGVKDEPWNIVHFPAFISSTLTSSPGTAAAKKKIDKQNAALWEKYLLSVSKFTMIATDFDFVLNEPAYWTYSGAEDSRVSLETMIERCLNLAHRSPIFDGASTWTPISWNEVDENIAIGSRLRYGRGQKPVVHHFGGVPV
jgi:hypothetical protein